MVETTEIKIFLDDVSRIREEAKSKENKDLMTVITVGSGIGGIYVGMAIGALFVIGAPVAIEPI